MSGDEVSGVETGEGAWSACPYISLCSNRRAGKTYKMPRTPILQGCKVLELREATTVRRDGPLAGGCLTVQNTATLHHGMGLEMD